MLIFLAALFIVKMAKTAVFSALQMVEHFHSPYKMRNKERGYFPSALLFNLFARLEPHENIPLAQATLVQ